MARRVQLGDLIFVKHGYAFPGNEFSDDPNLPVVVTPGNFEIGGGFKQANRIKTFAGEYSEEFVLDGGDLILSMTDLSKAGDTLGAPAFVPRDSVYLHNQRIGLVRKLPNREVSTDYLGYRLRMQDFRQFILSTATGTTVRHTSPQRIHGFKFDLPDLPIQRVCAELLRSLDDKIEANRGVATRGRSLVRAIYDRMICDAPRSSASAVLDPVLGGTPSRSDDSLWNGQVPWVSARDISNSPFGWITSTEEGISHSAARSRRLSPLQAGSVVITARGTVGKVAQLGIPAAINQSCYGLEPGRVPRGCLRLLVEDFANKSKAMVHGSVFDTITMSTFEYIDVPDFSDVGWAAVESQIAPIDALVEATINDVSTLIRTRDRLLPLLMSGEVSIKDIDGGVKNIV